MRKRSVAVYYSLNHGFLGRENKRPLDTVVHLPPKKEKSDRASVAAKCDLVSRLNLHFATELQPAFAMWTEWIDSSLL